VIFRNSIWVALDTGVGFAAALIISIAVARALGPVKLGYYSYVMWLTGISGAIGNLGIPAATRKYLAEFIGRGELAVCSGILKLTYRFQFLLSVLFVACGFGVVLFMVPPQHQHWATLAVFSLMPSMLMAIPSAANLAMEDLFANVWPSLISTVINLVGVVLTLIHGWELLGLTGSLLVARTVDLTVRYVLYRRRFGKLRGDADRGHSGDAKVVPSELKARIRRFCVQSSVLKSLNMVVWDRSEILFLKELSDIRQVAFYSLSFNITQQLLLVPQVFTSAASASLMVRVGREPEGVGRMAAAMLRYAALVALPLTVGMAGMASAVMRLLYGGQYEAAIPVLALLAFFAAAKACLPAGQQLLVAADRQDVLVKVMSATAVLNIALDLLLIPKGAAVGAAVANGISQMVAVMAIWVFAIRRLGVAIEWGPLGKMVFAAILMAACVVIPASLLPPPVAILVGAPFGAAIFLMLLRQTRALDYADRQRLLAIKNALPARLYGVCSRVIRFLIP